MRKIKELFYLLPLPVQRSCHRVKNLITVIKGGISLEINNVKSLYTAKYITGGVIVFF